MMCWQSGSNLGAPTALTEDQAWGVIPKGATSSRESDNPSLPEPYTHMKHHCIYKYPYT